MKHREALLNVTIAIVLLAAPLVADAQQPGKVPTIGYLSEFSGSADPPSPHLKAFLEGLRELGYVEGKNMAIEYRFTEGKRDRLPELAAELTRLKVDIIVTETEGSYIHRPNSEGGQALRSARGAANEICAGHQPEENERRA